MQKAYQDRGQEPPYKSLGAFRRAYRAEEGTTAYTNSHYWKARISEDKSSRTTTVRNEAVIKSEEYIKKFESLNIAKGKQLTSIVKAARDVTRRNSGTTNEIAICIDKYGHDVYRFSGTNSQAGFDPKKLQELSNRSVILIHNHPKSGSFSLDDIETILNYPAIDTIIAAGHDGTVYVLSVKNSKSVDTNLKIVYNELIQKYKNADKIVEALAEQFNWEYKKL